MPRSSPIQPQGHTGRRFTPGLCRLAIALGLAACCIPLVRAADPAIADPAWGIDRAAIRAQIATRGDMNTPRADGSTALHHAVHHDDAPLVRALLGAGASASRTNRYGVPPLHLACVNGSEEIVRLLLGSGADPNAAVAGGETMLMTAARTGRTGPVKALIERGATLDARDRRGQTALMWAAAEGHAPVVELLLRSGASAGARIKPGFTAMLFAAREGRLEAVRALLRAGVPATESVTTERGGGRMPIQGTSALLLAVENGHFELAMELVNAGADPNDQRTGFTPLHTVTWVRKPNRGDDDDGQPAPDGSGALTSLDFVRRIVARGADVNARLVKGSAGQGRLGLKGATPFLMAAKTADLPLMKLLVELGADAAMTNADGSTPLMAAAGLGCLAPDEEAGTEDECLEAVKYLLERHAEINAVDRNGETAMHGAAYKSLPRMVEFLADRGARVAVWNTTNRWGWTPLRIAEGYRPGNFKPAPETIAAVHRVLRAAGVAPAGEGAKPAAAKGY